MEPTIETPETPETPEEPVKSRHEQAYEFYNKVLGSPKYFVAPMIH